MFKALKLSVKGFYTFKVIRNGKIIKEAKSKNLILDYGMEQIFSLRGSNNFRLQVGSDDTPPDHSDSDLGVLVAESPNIAAFETNNSGNPNYSREAVFRHTFENGEAAGVIKESGFLIYMNASNKYLLSRSLILDDEGEPDEIIVTAQDDLMVEYTIVTKQSMEPVIDSFVLSGNKGGSYGYTIKPNDSVKRGGNFLKATSSTAEAKLYVVSGATTFEMTRDSLTVSGGLVSATYSLRTNQANYPAGIEGLRLVRGSTANNGIPFFDFDIELAPAINKTNQDTLKITVEVDFNQNSG